MSDEQEPIVSAELPSTAAIAPTVELETEEYRELPQDVGDETGSEADDNGEGGDELEDEIAELDFAFKKYNVPKSLKEAVEALRTDYTQKTQSTAETAKALEQREAALVQQAEASEAELDARATLRSVTAQLAAYEKLTPEDWNAHEMQDPIGTRQHERAFQHLKAQKAELEGTIGKASTERTEKAQQDLAKRVQETLEAAPKIIPGLTAETRTATIDKLVAFAHSEGIPEQVLKANWSPTLLGILHKAHIGAQAIAKQSAPKPAPTAAIAPLATVKAQASPTTARSVADLAKGDDMEAYAAARRAGKGR